MSSNDDTQLLVKVSYNDYRRIMKILQTYHNNLLKSRERTRKVKGIKGDDTRCIKDIPKMTIIEPLNISSNDILIPHMLTYKPSVTL